MPIVHQSMVRNRLLRALAPDDFDALAAHLQAVELDLKVVLVEKGRRLEHVHFIESGLASVVATSEDGEQIEVGHVGWEGLAGAQICLGVPVAGTRTFMQVAGNAWRVRAGEFEALLAERAPVRALFLRCV